jgi:LPXTG-motif cell wall-anchored protein
VPSACRRIAALFAVLALGAFAPVTSALAQGAGDQQYQDPFGGSGSGSSGSAGSGSSGSSGSKAQTTPGGNIQPLSPSPQTSGSGSSGSSSGSGSAGASGTGSSAATAAPQAAGSLPNTGLDTRLLLLGGVVLLLVGLGLRLRSAPERF